MDPRVALVAVANREAQRYAWTARVVTWTTYVRLAIPAGALAADTTADVNFDVEFTELPLCSGSPSVVAGTNPDGVVPFSSVPHPHSWKSRTVGDVADQWVGCKVDLAIQGEPGLQVVFELTFRGMAVGR